MQQSFDDAIREFTPLLPLAVAFSGGADSTALLVACAEKWPGQVVAVHVNHGVQAAAALFERHCKDFCAARALSVQVCQVNAAPQQGESPEAAARRARYKAFSALTLSGSAQTAIKSVAIAQHADDQAETLLLALVRGGGVAGLSAMPAHWARDGLDYHRPLLCVSAAEVRRWLAVRGIDFVDDPTNSDERFTRNRIRRQIMPAMKAAFPHLLETLGRSAAHAAQAQTLLDELARDDFSRVGREGDALASVRALRTLSKPRQANLLRYWLKHSVNVIPSTSQLNELLDQVHACSTRGHRIHIKVGQGFVERKGDALHWYNP